MKKITVKDLLDKGACHKGILFFKKNNLQEIDWDSIHTVNFYDKSEFLHVLCDYFHISLKNINKRTPFEIKFKDGLKIYYKGKNKIELYNEYQDRHLIHSMSSNGFECWIEYNDNGKIIHYKDSKNYEFWKEYNEKGLLCYFKINTGYEEWYEYNEQGRTIYIKDSNGNENWIEYNEQGLEIKKKYDNYKNVDYMYKSTIEYQYKNNLLINVIGPNDFTLHNEYDDKGNLIYRKNSLGNECIRKLNDQGLCVQNTLISKSETFNEWSEYKDGNCVHYKNSDGFEKWMEYKDGLLISYRDSTGYGYDTEYEDGIIVKEKTSNDKVWTDYRNKIKIINLAKVIID